MKFSEIGHRINGFGISTPILGFSVNWNPPESTKKIAREVIINLEDQRVLFNQYDLENKGHSVQAVRAMRTFLTQQISASSDDDLERSLRAMRSACRKFLDRLDTPPVVDQPSYLPHEIQSTLRLIDALAELRTTFGLHIGRLAAQYGIDIEEDLAKILPGDDSE